MKDLSEHESPDHARQLFISTLKVKFSLLGPVGTILDEIFFNYGERLKAERTDKLIKALDLEIQSLHKNQFDLNKLRDNPAFYDITLEVFKSAIKTNSDLKLAMLANFYLGQIVTQREINHDKNLLMVRIIDELTVTHLSIFRFLTEKVEDYKTLNNFQKVYDDYCKVNSSVAMDKSLFRAFIQDIENKSLCRFSLNVNEYGSTGGYMERENSTIVSGLTITDLGKDLIAHIRKSKYYG
jgi:hypothetical protein